MTLEVEDLPPQDALIATGLLEGKAHALVAAEAGCSERTVRRRLADDQFRAALRRLAQRRLEERGRLVTQASLEGVQVLRELATDRSTADSVRAAAARALVALGQLASSAVARDDGPCPSCGHQAIDQIGLRDRARERILAHHQNLA